MLYGIWELRFAAFRSTQHTAGKAGIINQSRYDYTNSPRTLQPLQGALFINSLKKLAKKQSFFPYLTFRRKYGKPRRTNQCAERWSEGPSLVGVADPFLKKPPVKHPDPCKNF